MKFGSPVLLLFGCINNTSVVYVPDGQTSAIIRSGPGMGDQVRLQAAAAEQRIQNNTPREGEEIPESVTAELEKLEEENGPMGTEADAVSAIFSNLVEEDDELLGMIYFFIHYVNSYEVLLK